VEKMLARLARQLDSLDEASLLDLWSKYATLTQRFEPTERWEEAALIFSLIQAKHWKNQLFNYNLAQMSRPAVHRPDSNEQQLTLNFGFSLEPKEKKSRRQEVSHCRVLSFKKDGAASRDDDSHES